MLYKINTHRFICVLTVKDNEVDVGDDKVVGHQRVTWMDVKSWLHNTATARVCP